MRRDPRSYRPKERAALIAAVEEAAENGRSVVRAAKALGITAAIYYRWIRERAKGGQPTRPADPERPAPNRGYPEQHKRELLAEIRQLVTQGQTIEVAARTVGISGKTYYNWTRPGMSAAPWPEPAAPPMRPVELVTALAPVPSPDPVEAPAPSTLTLIAPGSYRITLRRRCAAARARGSPPTRPLNC